MRQYLMTVLLAGNHWNITCQLIQHSKILCIFKYRKSDGKAVEHKLETLTKVQTKTIIILKIITWIYCQQNKVLQLFKYYLYKLVFYFYHDGVEFVRFCSKVI